MWGTKRKGISIPLSPWQGLSVVYTLDKPINIVIHYNPTMAWYDS